MKKATFIKCLLLIGCILFIYILLKNPIERIYKINIIKVVGANALVEEFNGKLNNKYWNVIDRGDNCNNELQYYNFKNITIKNSILEIEARKEKFNDYNYTSGMIDTKSKFEFLYGKIIFKAKQALGQGMLSAIWLLPADDSWLPEIDIIEILGTQEEQMWTGVHYLDSRSRLISNFANYSGNNDFNTYELNWNENEISCYVNNQLVYKTNQGIPNKKMYLIINLSVGGVWTLDPDDDAFPSRFLIDYIIVIPKELDIT